MQLNRLIDALGKEGRNFLGPEITPYCRPEITFRTEDVEGGGGCIWDARFRP